MSAMSAKSVVVLACALTFTSAWAQDREVEIAGRTLKCGNARIYLDRDLPNMGMAEPFSKTIVLNPRALATESPEVRWFIFYHECGHIMGHLNEKKADTYAVKRASEEGWLTENVLAKICRSYGDMDEPASRTHPAPRDRCNSLMASASRYQRPFSDPSVGTMVTSGPNPDASAPRPAEIPMGDQFMLSIAPGIR